MALEFLQSQREKGCPQLGRLRQNTLNTGIRAERCLNDVAALLLNGDKLFEQGNKQVLKLNYYKKSANRLKT